MSMGLSDTNVINEHEYLGQYGPYPQAPDILPIHILPIWWIYTQYLFIDGLIWH